jgi:phosphomannomutase
MPIKLNISGIRGKYSEFTPHWIARLVSAYVSRMEPGTFILARDKRPSGPFIRHASLTGFLSAGAHVRDAGILPTPILQWLIPHLQLRGGLSITAGHNPFEWNAMIFLNREGAYLNHFEGEEFFSLFHSGNPHLQPYDTQGHVIEETTSLTPYFKTLALPDSEKTEQKFVIDCVNGFDTGLILQLQQALKVHIIPLFSSPQESSIQRDPEPTTANAAFLSTVVRETKSQGGFLLNSDASRVLMVDERGIPYCEEVTFPLFSRLMLETVHSDLVTNYSTSKLIDDVARQYSVKVHRTDIGQSEVVHRAKELGCTLAGEGSGSTLFSPFSAGFDAFYTIRTVIDYLLKSHLSLSDLLSDFPLKPIYKESFFLEPRVIYETLERIGKSFPSSLRLKDGYYIDEGDAWICIRASATVNMIRVFAEGARMKPFLEKIKAMIRW